MMWYICVRLGQDRLLEYADGKNVGLKDIFKDAKEKYYPVSERHLYRWLAHYIRFGEVPEQTRRWKKATRGQKRKRDYVDLTEGEGVWTDSDTNHLKDIVDEHPALHLDEIQDHLLLKSGRSWSPSYLWKKLHDELQLFSTSCDKTGH